jgi:hypothetical protein
MDTAMLIGMSLIVPGIAAAAYGLLPRRPAQHSAHECCDANRDA